MNKEDSIEKKANRIWIVSFIIAGLCFLYGVLFESTTMIAEFIFLFTGFFGIAIFVQTKKPMIAKIIIISIVGLFFLVIGAIENILMGVVLSSVTVIPLLIILEISNMKSSKEKSLVTVTVLAVILLIVIILSVCSMVADRHTSSVSGGYYEETVIRQYNAGFVEFEGQTNVEARWVKALCRDVITHNKSNSEDTSLWINMHWDTTEPKTTNDANEGIKVSRYNNNIDKNVYNKIKTSGKYEIHCGYDPDTGYVVDITIMRKNKLTPNEYNEKFEKYNGKDDIKCADLRELIEDIQEDNKINENDSSLWINMHWDTTKPKTTNDAIGDMDVETYNNTIYENIDKNIKTDEIYEVHCGYDPDTRYVVDIAIKKTNKMTSREYNKEFERYNGKVNVKGEEIRALIYNVIRHNKYASDFSLWINMHWDTTEPKTTNDASEGMDAVTYNDKLWRLRDYEIKGNETYEVHCGYDPDTKYVVDITVMSTN